MTAPLAIASLSVAGRLSGVSLTVRPGTVHALVGPNGAGKSSVVQCVLGLLPFTGTVTVGAARLGLVPQRFHHASVLPMTVGDFLAASRTRWPVCLGVRAPVRTRVEAALREVGLLELAGRPLEALSGGELRRVLLANALEGGPDLLLLDEPEAGLDAGSLDWLEATLLARKAQGLAMLWVSHDEARVRRLADDVTHLVGGRHA